MSLTKQQTDWLECHYAYVNHMRIEAASLGYDLKAGGIANDRYIKLCVAYTKNHNAEFWPNVNRAHELLMLKTRKEARTA
jgi:hypothetical protein